MYRGQKNGEIENNLPPRFLFSYKRETSPIEVSSNIGSVKNVRNVGFWPRI